MHKDDRLPLKRAFQIVYFFRVHFPENENFNFSVFIKLFSRVLNIFRFGKRQIDGFDEPDTLVFTT